MPGEAHGDTAAACAEIQRSFEVFFLYDFSAALHQKLSFLPRDENILRDRKAQAIKLPFPQQIGQRFTAGSTDTERF